MTILTAFSLTFLFGCSTNNSAPSSPPEAPSPTGGSNQGQSELKVDIKGAGSSVAEDLYRPGVVAYGLLDVDQKDDYYALKQFTNSTRSRGGYVKIDEISAVLRTLQSASELSSKLTELDKAVSLAISGGSKVQLILGCMVPNKLSKLEGFNHDVISGINQASGQPIYSCAPVKPVQLAEDTWFSLMEETARYFSKYGDKVVFIIGNEPETYFAGNSAELFKLFELTALGLRSGNSKVKLGGLSPSNYKLDELGHTSPSYNAATDRFSFSKEKLTEPLMLLWLKYLNQKNIAIDIIQSKKFTGNPSPAASAFWVQAHQEIESWLQANPKSYSEHVELVFSDFPGWHTVCSEDLAGNRESNWDSEYFASWYVSTYIAMKTYASENKGIINNIEPLLGFLIEYGIPAFFHTSCEADKSKPAGFSGAMGLVTNKTKLPKPILHGLNFLTGLNGSTVKVDHDDPNIQAIAAYDTVNSQLTVLISHFVPSELNYNTAGYVGYAWGELFNNSYGFNLSFEQLRTMPPSPELQKYFTDSNFPKSLVQDLLAGDSVLNINNLGLTPDYVNFLGQIRTAGTRNRDLLDKRKNGLQKLIRLKLEGLGHGEYSLVHQAIDKNYGNAHGKRKSIQTKLEEAYSQGGEAAVNTKLIELRSEFGIQSTILSERNYPISGSSIVELGLDPNSVHLITLKKK